ncbi:MAG: M28 family peptidase, partial [Gammaproteobacteria bacterium]
MRVTGGAENEQRGWLCLACAVLGLTLMATGNVAAAEAWFGLKMPERRAQSSERHRQAYATPDLAPLSLRLSASDDPYAAIDGAVIYRYLEDIVRITLANRPDGEQYWGRIAGSAAERATADYVAGQFRAFGLRDVHTEPVIGGAQWWPTDWSVTVLADARYGQGTADYSFTSAFPALHLGEGARDVSVKAELIYVGLGRAVDLIGREVRGKIAVVRAELQPDPFFQTARGYIESIVRAGAVGVITIMDAPGNHRYALELLGSVEVPCFILGGADGRFLEDVIAAAGAEAPRVRLRSVAQLRPSWRGKNVLGLVPGRTDEYVLITAHLDGYFEAANDNAGGVAAALALAKFFADPARPAPARNLLFIGTSAHHEFSDGTRAFIAAHPDILARTALVFNIEHPSSIKSYYRGALKLERVTVPGQLITTTSQSKRSLTISKSTPQLVSAYQAAIDRYGLVVDAMIGRRPTGD